MRNPALAILYVIPVLVFGYGVFLGITASTAYENFNATTARKELVTQNVPGAEEMTYSDIKNNAWTKFQTQRAAAFGYMAGGVGALTLPLAVTAIGRSSKNAARELAETLTRRV